MPEQVDLDAQRMRSLVPLYISIAGITTAVFIGDLLTPLGVAIWILYVVPLGMTLFDRNPMQPINVALVITVLMVITVFTDQPGMTAWVAYANRGFGAAVVWTVAVLARGLILTRLGLASEEWVRRVQTSLLERLQGEHNVSELGERALNILRGAVNAPAAAMYSAAGADFRLVASQGVEHGNALPATFRRGDGLVGLAAREKQVTVLKNLPEGYFALKSAFATGSPRHVAICPAVIDNVTHGVLEFAFVHPPEARALDLLERSRDGVAAALRSAVYRERLQALLEETQRQSEELQTQQEELRVSNEELEEQSRALKMSQGRLEQQQAELEANNAQLEAQTQELELQKHALSLSRDEAERASQYKSEFLANMSHELRTPLNSALILAKLLAENKDGHLSDGEVRYAETIYSAGNNLLTLINDILDLAKIEAGAVELRPEEVAAVSVVDALHRTFQPMADERRLQFSIDIATRHARHHQYR